MDEDWDNLLILDACRSDVFEEVADLSDFDKYGTVKSIGSATPEWTERNFANEKFGDTVYVSANPHTSKIAGDSFHRIVEVWKQNYDPEFGAVYPEPVTEAALDAFQSDKRLVVHYIQPHPPFIDQSFDYEFRGWDPLIKGTDDDQEVGFWQALEEGELSRDAVWDAYKKNLEAVLSSVLELNSKLPGKTVISSDHGTLFGERLWPLPVRGYSHARDLRHPKLIRVPWAVSEGERRETTDEGTNAVSVDEDAINERLAALGYANEGNS